MNTQPNLPKTIAANAVVPEASPESNVHASAKALSVCKNAELMTLSISLGNFTSSKMKRGR